jgi:3-oxoacyl-(acyl-carrier-protein) synthase
MSRGVVVTGAGLVAGASIDALLESRLSPHMLRRTDRLSQMIVTAALLAAEGARWRAGDGLRAGVVVGTGLGCLQRTDQYLDGIVRDGVAHADALTFPDTVDNAPAAHVSLSLECRGPSLTVSQHEISGECAVVLGALLLRRRLVSTVVVAAGDVASPRLRQALGRLAPRLRPGDGAAALLLEAEEEAARRGAPVLGRLLGYAQAAAPETGRRLHVAPIQVLREAAGEACRMAGHGAPPAVEALTVDEAPAVDGKSAANEGPAAWMMADGVIRSVQALERLARDGRQAVLVGRTARGGMAAALLFGRAIPAS